MRRSTVLGAASAAALAAGSLAASGVFGSSHREAPGSCSDPTADNTDVYAFTAPDAPGSLTVVANWIPLEEPAGGPYFGKLDPKARYYVKIDNTGDGLRGRRLPLAVQDQVPQPELVPVRGPDGRLGRRSGPQLRPDVRPLQGDLQGPQGESAHERIADDVPVAPGQRRPEDDPELRPGRGRRGVTPLQRRRQDVRRPGRRPVLRRPRRDLRRHQHRQARPAEHRPRQPGRRQGRRRRATTRTSFVLQVPEARGHARRQAGLRRERRATPSSACGRRPSAAAHQRARPPHGKGT